MFAAFLKKVRSKSAPPAPPKKKYSRLLAEQTGPPITAIERSGNLSDWERELNASMQCPAGKNQVLIRSVITPTGTTQPRIALKCHLRRDIGEDPLVFFTEIRQLCCADPSKCPAYAKLKERFVAT